MVSLDKDTVFPRSMDNHQVVVVGVGGGLGGLGVMPREKKAKTNKQSNAPKVAFKLLFIP